MNGADIQINKRKINKIRFERAIQIKPEINLKENKQRFKQMINNRTSRNLITSYGFIVGNCNFIAITNLCILYNNTIETLSHESIHLVVRDLFKDAKEGLITTKKLDSGGYLSVLKKLGREGYLGDKDIIT